MNELDASSTRPYLIRALYEWCTDNGLTPYVAVAVDDTVKVPREYVKNGEIVLNIGIDATSSMKLGNEFIEFKARFAGSAREIIVPISHVLAIYARENGQGMAFPAELPPEGQLATRAPVSTLVGGAEIAGDAAAAVTPESPVPASLTHARADGGESMFMQLVPDTAKSGPSDGSETDPTKPPTPPRSRPSLKRVK